MHSNIGGLSNNEVVFITYATKVVGYSIASKYKNLYFLNTTNNNTILKKPFKTILN